MFHKGVVNMIIESQEDKFDTLEESDLQYMGKQLLKIVQVIREEVYVGHDKDAIDALNKLEDIGKLIVLKRYRELINDINVITKNEDTHVETGNYYLDMSRYYDNLPF